MNSADQIYFTCFKCSPSAILLINVFIHHNPQNRLWKTIHSFSLTWLKGVINWIECAHSRVFQWIWAYSNIFDMVTIIKSAHEIYFTGFKSSLITLLLISFFNHHNPHNRLWNTISCFSLACMKSLSNKFHVFHWLWTHIDILQTVTIIKRAD